MLGEQQEWYTIDEAANYLRVSRRTMYQLIKERQLKAYRVGARGHKRFRHEELDHVMTKEDGDDLYGMNSAADPVLAELWDNERDAEYDNM